MNRVRKCLEEVKEGIVEVGCLGGLGCGLIFFYLDEVIYLV